MILERNSSSSLALIVDSLIFSSIFSLTEIQCKYIRPHSFTQSTLLLSLHYPVLTSPPPIGTCLSKQEADIVDICFSSKAFRT